MTIARLKAEFGFKDLVTYGTLVVALLFGGFKLDSLVKTNAEGVIALHSIVESLDQRIGLLEEDKLAEESFDAGYQKALEEMNTDG